MDATLQTPARVEDHATDPLRESLVEAIGGDYEIVRLIGRGGMGAVYLARDRALERLVAIKVLPPGSATDAGVLERFRREAKTVASLQHPGIVPLYAFGERRGLCWFVMGYVRGESLATRLERDGVMELDTARGLLAQVADALDHAHRQGIVHRDIKPDNILIDDTTGRALLTDFGIARADTMQAGTSLTQVGSVMGTPHYMSPEQATAEPQIDGRSDLYSVGVVGYQMLSGRLPFDGRSFRELLMQHVSTTPPPLATIAPQVPADVADAVMRCLEKDPGRRFPDGRSFRNALGGEAQDDESLGYALADLQHAVPHFLLTAVVGITLAVTSAVRSTPLFVLPWYFWLLMLPVPALGYWAKLRDARQRGYEWSTIWRVAMLPPRWWFMWWPRRWRRTGDVYDRLPGTVKLARHLNMAGMFLLLLEAPLLAWCTDDRQLVLRERTPSSHAFHAVEWVGSQGLLSVLLVLVGFLLLLALVLVANHLLVVRAGKPYGLSHIDCRRLSYKPTDSSFFRDPRIQPLVRGARAEQKPSTPQEFVSQILLSTGRLTPAAGTTGVESPVAARRLQEAIAACEREASLLEKAAPREQLDRLEAELVLLESEQADPEAIALLEGQRAAIIRSRERLHLLQERRETAMQALETLWSDVRRLANATDATQLRELAERVSAQCRAIQEAYPPRRSRTTTATAAVASLLVLLSAAGVAAAAVEARGTMDGARALLRRSQPDSALAMLATLPATDATRSTLEGLALLQTGHVRGMGVRVRAARGSLRAFSAALARDSSQVEALEGLIWLRRLLPWILGGRTGEVPALLAALERRSPYRGQLMRAYMARLDGTAHVADSLIRQLITAHPDSAAAWYALGDGALESERADEAMAAFRRYRTLMPDDPSALYRIGRVAAQHGVGLDEGEQALRAYLAIPRRLTLNTHAAAWWRLGQIAEKRGQVAAARAAYVKATTMDSSDEDFRASLEAIDARAGR